MAVFNHNLTYRPLRGGIAVLNPLVNKIGTLGIIATSDGNDRWMISCYHVLGRIDFSTFADGEPIFQPVDGASPAVARVSIAKSDVMLDYAAARLEPAVDGVGDILGLEPVTALGDPVKGMRVIKSGGATGVTEGVITDIVGDEVVIGVAAGFGATYELSGEGDSGAVWVSRATGEAIALHHSGNNSGAHEARGTKIKRVFAAAQLRLLP